MKTLLMLSVITLSLPGIARASIIHNSNVILSSPGYAGFSDYSLDIQQDATATDETFGFFDRSLNLLTYQGPTLDAGLILAFADFGDPIPAPPVTAGTPLNTGQTYDVGYTAFYLAFFADAADYASKITGWVLLANTPSGLLMLENAVAYGGEPMSVGVIPEPSSVALLAAGGGIIYLRKRNPSLSGCRAYDNGAG